MNIFECIVLFVISLCISSTILSVDEKEQALNPSITSSIKKNLIQPIDLDKASIQYPKTPGVYKTFNIEIIFGYAFENFDEKDLVVSDVDDVLIAGVDPFYFEHNQKKTPLNEQLFSQPQDKLDKFFLFLWAAKKWVLMEPQTPELISQLQRKNIKLIANTALNPVVDLNRMIDLPSWRVKMLLDHFRIDFSISFPMIPSWDFDSLHGYHAGDLPPFFKQGIILSGATAKHTSLLAFLEKVQFKPKKILYVDDREENCIQMYESLQDQGIECYSFIYTRVDFEPPQKYLSQDQYLENLKVIENFVEKLILGQDVDGLISEYFNKV